MYYEPDTIWGRTVRGDREMTVPHSGLSVVQRRVLKQLGHPRTFATLVARHRIPPPKLEHELIRLAELELVAFQRPGAAQPRTAPRIQGSTPPPAAPEPWQPPLPVYVAAAACGIGTVLLLMS